MISGLLAATASCARDEAAIRKSTRLRARPGDPVKKSQAGQQALGLATPRDALLYIPKSYTPEKPIPLVVWLHGAGGNERRGIELLRSQADARGLVVLSPSSRRSTWDVIERELGPDVSFIDAALERTFELCNIDPARIAIAGFSDGASYALTLGLMNGDLFTHILSFSPGFTAHQSATGEPRIFVSHGIRDEVLPIDRCSRRIVPILKSAGYHVDYREFPGPHTVPPEMLEAAVRQLAGNSRP